MPWLKSPASIRNCVGCLLIVSAMLRWMSGIRCRSSSCIIMHMCSMRIEFRGLFELIVIGDGG